MLDEELDGLEEEVINSALVRSALKMEAENVAARKRKALAEASADREIAEAATTLEQLMRDPKVSTAELDKQLQKALAAQRAKLGR